MFNQSKRWIWVLIISCAVITIDIALAGGEGGVDVGNGGNGIIGANGRVRLVDLAELSINPDTIIQANIASKQMSQNYTIQYSVRKLLKSKFDRDGYVISDLVSTALSTQLSILSYRYPTFVKRILDSIEKMQWERTPSLSPNRDAKLKLVLADDEKEIGCAENKFGRVQISQVCEKNMSPGHFAALIVHEAIYAYLATEDSRVAAELEDSTPARRVVAEVFRAKTDEISPNANRPDTFQSRIMSITLPGEKEITGIRELFTPDQGISNTFFPGNRRFAASYSCSFENTDSALLLKSLSFSIQFQGAYFASGYTDSADEHALDRFSCANQIFGFSNRADRIQNSCLQSSQYQLSQSWLVTDVPTFNVESGIATLSLLKLNSREKMILHVSVNRDVPSKLEVYRRYNPETDRYQLSFSIDGACKVEL